MVGQLGMAKKVYYISLVFFITCLGCREQFDFEYDEVPDGRVVIDGFITDRATSHTVRVSYSTTINERGLIETRFVSDASVRLYDDQGQFTVLTYDQSGLYLTAPLFKAEEGRSYRLEVVLANGEVYETAVKALPPASPAVAEVQITPVRRPVLSNNQLQEEDGISVTSEVLRDGQTHYYQWLAGRFFIFDADRAPEFNNVANQFCYVRDFTPSRVDVFKDVPTAGQGGTFEYEVDYIPLQGNTGKMKVEYGVEARLLTLNQEDFEFWEQVKDLSENNGGLFDAAPFSLRGNVTNQQSGELALGYFGVYRESVDRHFFQYDELGFPPVEYLPCILPRPLELPHPCVDCRDFDSEVNYGVIRPEWWGN